jgi:hypothetical protein
LAQALAKEVVAIVFALAQSLFKDDDNNNNNDAAFISPCRPCHCCQAATLLVWGLIVALAWSLA